MGNRSDWFAAAMLSKLLSAMEPNLGLLSLLLLNSTRSYSESFIPPAVVDFSSDFSYVEDVDSFHTHTENSVKQILDIRMKGE